MGINTDLLRATRRNKKLTQDEVAQKIGVSRTSYLKYEKGTHEPDFDTLENETCIKKEAAKKLLLRAVNEKMIFDISIEENKIILSK